MNQKQAQVLDAVTRGKNVLLTGAAGTGKSFTVAKIKDWAHRSNKPIALTAATGLAALQIHGKTIHSFLGIGLGTLPPEIQSQKTRKNKPLTAQLQALRILVIDEISMIDSALLTYISDYLSLLRSCTKPFGGIQVIACGDFCQLPPVGNYDYCFTCDAWSNAQFETIILHEQIRQSSDLVFQNMLSELRWGECSAESLEILLDLKSKEFANGVEPTKLFPTNNLVDEINEREFKKLGGEVFAFPKTFKGHAAFHKHIPESISLALNAQVLVTTNLSRTVVNGTRGVVCDINPSTVTVRLLNGEEVPIPMTTVKSHDNEKDTCTFLPLKLAYALSIHKSQGMTLDAIEIDIGANVFEYGQAYVALSRARNLDSIKILNIKASSFKTHSKVKAFYNHV